MSKPLSESDKITDLEIRLSFQEDLLTTLNQRVAEQDKEIDALSQQLKFMYEKFKSLTESLNNNGTDTNQIETPPHY